MRLLVHGGILALFGIVAVVAMTILFSAQIRFDQAAELQIRGHTTPGGASTIATAAHALFAEAGEARASPGNNQSSRGEEAVPPGATTSPLVQRLDYPLLDPSVLSAPEPSLIPPASAADLIETRADSRFTSVRVTRPGAEPTVYRVPRER
jgi:hypothetical protein